MVNILVAAVTAIAAASWVRHYRHKIAIPWFTARKVPVEITTSSARAAETNFQQGLLGRIRRTAMKEYHGFGIISEGIDGGCHYTIAGGQGDPTCSLVSDPPTHLYTRQLKFAGLTYLTHLYRRGIAICTDIGAALSTCVQLDKRFLLWIGSDIEKTFCHVLLATIKHTIPKERDILRMKIEGRRPDAMKMLKDIYVAYKAEVILITSNP
ncbi:hypothetical protein EW026_g4190 [Hermanssonia centrifuga]|uniref:Uncharacterized protein n=1 Tax=Hermanssonia centrifuga TaxID=98765 RepID=A0A4S4KIW1_9APHY|nr:hypothetical protein EW026_g4190 [Hermanssonia centrifuga]